MVQVTLQWCSRNILFVFQSKDLLNIHVNGGFGHWHRQSLIERVRVIITKKLMYVCLFGCSHYQDQRTIFLSLDWLARCAMPHSEKALLEAGMSEWQWLRQTFKSVSYVILGGSHQCTPGLLRRHLSSYSTSACLSSRCCCLTLMRKQTKVMGCSPVWYS